MYIDSMRKNRLVPNEEGGIVGISLASLKSYLKEVLPMDVLER